MRARAISVNFLLLSFFASVSCEHAGAAEQPFYAGKTITVVIATGPGGTGSLRYTTVIKFLPRYIPGNPTIRPHYLPGAGGVAAANNPITGEEIEKALAQLPRDPKIMQMYKEISGLGTLPPVR